MLIKQGKMKKDEKKMKKVLRSPCNLSLCPYRQRETNQPTNRPTKDMTTEKQIEEMEKANLSRLQISNIKNDPKTYTDAQIAEYIKNCK